MSYKQNTSNYIDEVNMQAARIGVNTRVSPIVFLLSVFSAAFIMLLAIQPVFNGLANKGSGTSANASGFFCSTTMGYGMDERAPWSQSFKDYPLPEKTGRTWTLQEALSGGIGVVNYSGEGEGGSWLISDKETPTGKNYKDHAAQYSDKLEAERNLGGCAIGSLLGSIANLGLITADLISGVSQFFATKAFDTELICPDPSNPDGSCLNLGKVVGGTGSQTGGIIGALTSSVYMPLLVIAVTIAAGWIIYIGIVKRRIREALVGAIWVILSVIIGLAFLLNPSLLVKAPISLSNAVSTCVIGAFNGENCMTRGSSGNGIDGELNSSKNVCRSDVNGASVPESMMLTTNAITCSIWKAFVLEPYAQISFGMSFEDLDTQNGAINSAVTEAGMQGNEFCVDMYSSKSYNQMKGRTLELNGGRKVCNLLAYQMMLKTDIKSGSETLSSNGSIDDRWYKIVATAAANDAVWSHWSGNSTSGINQIMLSLLAVITSALGSFIIIVTSVFALVYYVSTVLLMAFAPVFLLLGIHPGRGKKIMFGWFEKVVSNILKYFVSAVFLIVTLVIYGGILASATNMGLILMFVIIVTMALFLYRQELMNLLGRANMGGEQLSGALSTSLGNMAQGAGRKTKSIAGLAASTGTGMAGGAAGAFLASGGVSVGDRLKNTYSGAKDAGKRHISRQGGFVGNVARQYERSSVDNQRDLRQKAQDAQKELIDYGNDVVREQNTLDAADTALTSSVKDSETDEKAFTDLDGKMKEFRTAEDETLEDMKNGSESKSSQRISVLDREIDEIASDNSLSPEEKRSMVEAKESEIASIEHNNRVVVDFANYQGLLNDIQEAKMNLSYAEAIGDQAGIDEQNAIIDEKSAERDELYDSIGARNAGILNRRYNKDLQDHLTKQGIQSFSNEDFENYQDLRLKVKTSQEAIESATSKRDLAKIDHELSQVQRDRQEMIYNAYDSTVRNLKPGQSLQEHDLDKMYATLEKDLEKANLSEERINGLQAKADEIRASSSEFSTPYLAKVDGRLNQFDDSNRDNDDNLPPLDGGGSSAVPAPFSGDKPESVGKAPQSDFNQQDKEIPVSSNSVLSEGNTTAPKFDGDRRHRKLQESDPMPTPVDTNKDNYSDLVDDKFVPPAENEVLPLDPKDDRVVAPSRPLPSRPAQSFNPPEQRKGQAEQFNNSETPVAPSNNAVSENKNQGLPKKPTNKIAPPPFAPDTPMPTPVDPNHGVYAAPEERYIPVADDEIVSPDSKDDRKSYVNNSTNKENQAPTQNRSASDSNSGRRGKTPTNKIAPPPFAPDKPMPTPVDPNQANYESIDDRYAPPAEDEVLPKDSRNDRKDHLNREKKIAEGNARAAARRDADRDSAKISRDSSNTAESAYRSAYSERLAEKAGNSETFEAPGGIRQESRNNGSAEKSARERARVDADKNENSSRSLFGKPSQEDEELTNDHFNQQQELLMDDEEEKAIHRAKNEKQERVRDNFLKGTQEAISRNEELKKVRRPRRSLPTSPNKSKNED